MRASRLASCGSPVDFQSARLERVGGVAPIAFERGKDYVIVHLVDTPFEWVALRIPPRLPASPRKSSG